MPLGLCQEVEKKMPPQKSDVDLNPQKVGSDSVSETMTFQKKSRRERYIVRNYAACNPANNTIFANLSYLEARFIA